MNGISYDLTIGVICGIDEKENIHYDLRPGETVFVKTKEKLAIPLNILARIAEKNSRMRQGLKVDGPHYQPGHVTFAFLRIQNISNNTIELSAGMRIAQIIFEELVSRQMLHLKMKKIIVGWEVIKKNMISRQKWR
mgnify:CR=1 FL=1